MHDLLMAEPTDANLAHAWAAGDERAYDAIVVRYAPLIFGRCRRALGETDADDATQAVFLILAQKREQAAASPVLAAWLMTVASNVVRNAWRDHQRRRQAEQSVPPLEPSASEPSMPDIKEHLDACLEELPAKEREVVLLHHLAAMALSNTHKLLPELLMRRIICEFLLDIAQSPGVGASWAISTARSLPTAS